MNTPLPPNTQEVLHIDASMLKDQKKEYDAESNFRYWNPQFYMIGLLLIVIFSIQLYYGLPAGEDIDLTNFTYKFSNYRDGGAIYGIFTAMFLHGSIQHLLSNLIFLYPFTLITTSILKTEDYIGVILITGIMAGIGSHLLNDIPSLGASGWIFGVFGFLVPYYLYYKEHLSKNVQDIPWAFLFMAVYTVWQGFADPYIDNVAHIFGFISGIIYGFIYFQPTIKKTPQI